MLHSVAFLFEQRVPEFKSVVPGAPVKIWADHKRGGARKELVQFGKSQERGLKLNISFHPTGYSQTACSLHAAVPHARQAVDELLRALLEQLLQQFRGLLRAVQRTHL